MQNYNNLFIYTRVIKQTSQNSFTFVTFVIIIFFTFVEIILFMMDYLSYKERSLEGRYIPSKSLIPLLQKYAALIEPFVGFSNQQKNINTLKIGEGDIKILFWSQMHGNETTGTKAVFDLLNYYTSNPLSKNVSLYIIPMLNPDGADNFTRVNGENIDLNRDALNSTQPEMKYLKAVYERINPDLCINLHDQRTIFGLEKSLTPATLSFLSPAYNPEREVNNVRIKAMEIITHVAKKISEFIPQQIGRFDDSFNVNCTGDFFTHCGTPTILIEAGHFPNDYQREKTREYLFYSLLEIVNYICNENISTEKYEDYFLIPDNKKICCDILIFSQKRKYAFQYKEVLKNNRIYFELEILDEQTSKNVLVGHRQFNLDDILPCDQMSEMTNIEQLLLSKLGEKYNF